MRRVVSNIALMIFIVVLFGIFFRFLVFEKYKYGEEYEAEVINKYTERRSGVKRNGVRYVVEVGIDTQDTPKEGNLSTYTSKRVYNKLTEGDKIYVIVVDDDKSIAFLDSVYLGRKGSFFQSVEYVEN